MPKVRAKTIWVDRWEKTPARTAQDKIKRRTPAGSSLAGVLLFCTNLTQPTGALDTASGFEVMRLFRELIDDEDITIVMTTHDPNLMELGDEVFELSDGIVI